MPSQTKVRVRSLCIYGDSHLGCLKHALDKGLPGAAGINLEYWGAHGPDFRKLRLKGGAIVPDAEARETVEKINQQGRAILRSGDHDAILFHACRLRAFDVFAEFLNAAHDEAAHISGAVRAATLKAWLEGNRSFRIAREFAASGEVLVAFTPGPFPTAGIGPDPLRKTPAARKGTAKDRAALWAEIGAHFKAAGIHFLPQPEKTVTEGCLTDPAYAVDLAAERQDPVHKNEAYARAVLEPLFNLF